MKSEDRDKTVDFSPLRGVMAPKSTIIAVGGGKGGVGKSFVSSSIAIFLSHLGYKTLAVDLDLGGANLHTNLGEGLPGCGINEFLSNPNMRFQDAVSSTRFPHLQLISGASDELDTADISPQNRSRLMSEIFHYPADYIVLDLSAGTHNATLDFFLMATRKVVVMTPEPSSMENAYRFMKSAFYRQIRRFESQFGLAEKVAHLMSQKATYGIRCPADLLRTLQRLEPVNGLQLSQLMQNTCFEIVLNQGRTFKDLELGAGVQSVCTKYFGVPAQLLGQLEFDNAVWQTLRKRRHLLIEHPHSRLYAQLMSISRKFLHARPKPILSAVNE